MRWGAFRVWAGGWGGGGGGWGGGAGDLCLMMIDDDGGREAVFASTRSAGLACRVDCAQARVLGRLQCVMLLFYKCCAVWTCLVCVRNGQCGMVSGTWPPKPGRPAMEDVDDELSDPTSLSTLPSELLEQVCAHLSASLHTLRARIACAPSFGTRSILGCVPRRCAARGAASAAHETATRYGTWCVVCVAE